MVDLDEVPVYEATQIWSGVEYGARLNGKMFVSLEDWDALVYEYKQLKMDYEDLIKK